MTDLTNTGNAANSPAEVLLQVSDLRITFAGREVVHGIDFSVRKGEKLALVGESGSGKTVSALAMLGLAQGAQVTGHAFFHTGPAHSATVDILALPARALQDLRGRDIAMVFQEPMTALNPLFTVGEQIAEVVQLKEGLSAAQAWAVAVQLLSDTGIDEPQRRAGAYPHQLSGGQRQRAMIAMALACKPKLLLADEPTTALDVTVRQQILDLLTDLQRAYGMAVVLITHDLRMVRQFADRVAVMENGHIVEHGEVSTLFENPQHAYTRRLLASRPERKLVALDAGAQEILRAENLSVRYDTALPGIKGWFSKGSFTAVDQATLSMQAGQSLGVVGESGSGKSSLALALLGLHPHGGDLTLMQTHWGLGRASDLALRQKMQVVFQDPFSSLSPRLTLGDIVGEGLLVHQPTLTAAQRRQLALQVLEEVGLTEVQFPGLLERYPHQFSGGQRQRIAIARALIVKPSLLVLDEPTSALDVTMAKQVLSLLQSLQEERGLAFLLITHDIDVIRAMTHRMVVMQNGNIVEAGETLAVLERAQHPYTRSLLASYRE
jgi:microcin C transport system ATP-binding protein